MDKFLDAVSTDTPDMAKDRYTSVAITLHWLMAAGILFLLALGWYMSDLPKGAERSALIGFHKSVGITVFALLLLRVAWRLAHRPPPLPSTMAHWTQKLARGNHYLLYVLMFIQPLSGYLSSSFSGYHTSYFGLPLLNWGWKDKPLNHIFNTLHSVDAYLLALVIGVHVVAALKHLLLERDGVFQRMLP